MTNQELINIIRECKKSKTGEDYVQGVYLSNDGIHFVDSRKEYPIGDQAYPAWSFYIHLTSKGEILQIQSGDLEDLGEKKERELNNSCPTYLQLSEFLKEATL